jgi:hypothetical protein
MQGSALTCNLLKSFPTKSQLKAQMVPVFEDEYQVVSEKRKSVKIKQSNLSTTITLGTKKVAVKHRC